METYDIKTYRKEGTRLIESETIRNLSYSQMKTIGAVLDRAKVRYQVKVVKG